MAEEKEEITCECQEIHEDLLKIVNETMPDEEELYDLSVDKDCMNNLAGNEKYAKIKKAMRQLLFDELRAQKDPRLVGDGDTFDRYPFWKKNSNDFYERVQSGEIKEPWKMSGFVSPTDFENHPDNK